MKNTLIFDNYDSFTYNLVQVLKTLGHTNYEVHRNNKITLTEIDRFDKIILSPGPGIPSEAGLLMPLLKQYAATKSILGVCLGHQAIGEHFGAKLINLDNVFHGVSTAIKVIKPHRLFDNMPETFEAGRYHSWIVDNNNLPDCLTVTAVDEQGLIMAMRHNVYDLHGVQFHPESILTPNGTSIIENFLKN